MCEVILGIVILHDNTKNSSGSFFPFISMKLQNHPDDFFQPSEPDSIPHKKTDVHHTPVMHI